MKTNVIETRNKCPLCLVAARKGSDWPGVDIFGSSVVEKKLCKLLPYFVMRIGCLLQTLSRFHEMGSAGISVIWLTAQGSYHSLSWQFAG